MPKQMLKLPRMKPGKEMDIDDDPDSPEKPCEKLLGALVLQALHDDMTSLSMGVDANGDKLFLRVFGPKHLAEPQWWELTPPPLELYPLLLQRVIALTKVQRGLPFKGSLTTKGRGVCMVLRVELPEITRFELNWG